MVDAVYGPSVILIGVMTGALAFAIAAIRLDRGLPPPSRRSYSAHIGIGGNLAAFSTNKINSLSGFAGRNS
jgi:hypothetical protein